MDADFGNGSCSSNELEREETRKSHPALMSGCRQPIFRVFLRFVYGRCHPLARHSEKPISHFRIGSQSGQPLAFARIADAFFIREHGRTRFYCDDNRSTTRFLNHRYRAQLPVGTALSVRS